MQMSKLSRAIVFATVGVALTVAASSAAVTFGREKLRATTKTQGDRSQPLPPPPIPSTNKCLVQWNACTTGLTSTDPKVAACKIQFNECLQ